MGRLADFFRSRKAREAESVPAERTAPETPVVAGAAPSPEKAPPPTAHAEPGLPAAPTAPAAVEKGIEERVIDVLRDTFDPEIPVNIYELGLIYETRVDPPGAVYIKMTLTSPMCPVAGSLPPEVAGKVRGLAGVTDVEVDLVWDPPWNPSMMTEAARLQLGMM